LLVTIVSTIIYLYSVGYMHGDPAFLKFFTYMSLFTFSMCMLVMANNFLQLYFGWEAVGLCSYLLIAFWYERKSALDASVKAFVVNRVGDYGFSLGIFLIFVVYGTVNYADVFARAAEPVGRTLSILGYQVDILTLIALLLFCGAVGKSAQLPLHTWLPDAMEGPTPISALIHAATMVTAGVFMVARLNPIYNLSETAMMTVAIVGGVTGLFAATIAVTQYDIKRIVAYSTLSQLGYMMMALGLGAYVAGIFHLLSHGAFKALLFLAAGSVIHALSGEQDIRKMGGISKYLPITLPTMWIGSLALSGVPIFAGFFSKDWILWEAYISGTLGKFLWALGFVGAIFTAFYSFRLIFMTFHGRSRVEEKVKQHIHESPAVMTIPLILLAILSTTVGFAGISFISGMNWIQGFLGPVFGTPVHLAAHPHAEHSHGEEYSLMAISVLVAFGAILLASFFYLKRTDIPDKLASALKPLYLLSFRKYYFDEIYDLLFVRTTYGLSRYFWDFWDKAVIDGFVNGVGWVTALWSRGMRRVQTGQVQHYALAMAMGVVVIVGVYLIW
ncbi:MAG: NADH-quinone oxidoreductase subunit L, partial [Nitrospirae bacterium]|nr:NADH-quinone oxidoreductase subunit L [Nitrospirota bacterium]